MQIELNILFHSDQTSQLKDIGIGYDLEDCETRKMMFYNINSISVYLDNGKEYASIHANGTEYVCVDDYQTVINKINGLKKTPL